MFNLIYVFDAYCGWCYGFGPTIRELEAAPDVNVTVLGGSLFSGDRSGPISHYPHIPEANDRIAAMTGVTFGAAYQEALQEGSLVLNSWDATRGLVALKSLAGPNRDLEMASAMQTAFYQDGLSLSDTTTYLHIGEQHGLDLSTLTETLAAETTARAASEEVDLISEWGISSYPTLLLEDGQTLTRIGSHLADAQQLRSMIEEHAHSK